MKNYIQAGNTLTFTATTDVASGDGVQEGALFGIAAISAAVGEEFEADIVGVFDLPKGSGAITKGAKVYWKASPGEITTTVTGNSLVGAATEPAADGETIVRVRLNGVV